MWQDWIRRQNSDKIVTNDKVRKLRVFLLTIFLHVSIHKKCKKSSQAKNSSNKKNQFILYFLSIFCEFKQKGKQLFVMCLTVQMWWKSSVN